MFIGIQILKKFVPHKGPPLNRGAQCHGIIGILVNPALVIAISVFDLMILYIALRVALGFGIIFTKFDLRQLIHD